jgi:adenylylsulfate kinase-like enzyme
VSDPAAPRAVLLTGVLGAGKTALAIELGDMLGERGAATAVIDLDWLGWWYPGTGSAIAPADLIVRNLEAVWRTFRTEGARYLVMARMIQSTDEVDRIKTVLGDASLVVVRVDASNDVIEARLRVRDTGAELAAHLEELSAMAAAVDQLQIEDLRIDNGGRPIRAVATDLLASLGWG